MRMQPSEGVTICQNLPWSPELLSIFAFLSRERLHRSGVAVLVGQTSSRILQDFVVMTLSNDGAFADHRCVVAAVSALVGVSYHAYDAGSKEKKQLPDMPPSGVSLSEFLSAVMQGTGLTMQWEWLEKYGPVFTVRSPVPFIIPNQVYIANPKVVKTLCIKEANMYREPSRFATRTPDFAAKTRNTVGDGVTGLVGEEWGEKRLY